jgi:integrase/recombinase XerC
MRQRGLSEETIALRLKALKYLTDHAQRPLLALTAEHLDAWQITLGPLSRETQRAYKGQVRGFFRWAVEDAHLLEASPADVLILPRAPRHMPRPIPERDLELALESAPQPVRLWLELAAFAGARAMEIAVLERPDVLDDGQPPALVLHGKGGKVRVVPLAPRLLRDLVDFGLPARGRLFWVSGRPVSAKKVSELSNRFLHRAGIASTIHTLRHRFATRMLSAGANVRQVQELLGHASPATTAVYTLIVPADTAPLVAAIDRPLLRPAQETAS